MSTRRRTGLVAGKFHRDELTPDELAAIARAEALAAHVDAVCAANRHAAPPPASSNVLGDRMERRQKFERDEQFLQKKLAQRRKRQTNDSQEGT